MSFRLILLVLIITLPVGLQLSGVVDFLSIEYLKQNEAILAEIRQRHPHAALIAFATIYTLVCALPIPAVAILTLAAGVLFGFLNGLVLVSFSSAIGATLAFLLARYLGQEFTHRLLGKRIAGIDQELKDAGFLYATSLRLIPGIPFFVINTALGLSTMRAATFYFSTQVGMLLMLALLVYAGSNLGQVNSLRDALSMRVLVSLALLALVPLLFRLFSKRLKARDKL